MAYPGTKRILRCSVPVSHTDLKLTFSRKSTVPSCQRPGLPREVTRGRQMGRAALSSLSTGSADVTVVRWPPEQGASSCLTSVFFSLLSLCLSQGPSAPQFAGYIFLKCQSSSRLNFPSSPTADPGRTLQFAWFIFQRSLRPSCFRARATFLVLKFSPLSPDTHNP